MGKVIKTKTTNGQLASATYRQYGNRQKDRIAIFDRQSALVAMRMRDKMPDARTRQDILSRAEKYVPDMVKEAREIDRLALKKVMKK